MSCLHRVAIAAYNGLCTFEYGIAVEVFALRRLGPDVPWYQSIVCACEPGPLRGMGQLLVDTTHGLDTFAIADTIVIPGWRDHKEKPPKPLCDALRTAYDRGARIISICSGVFVVGAAGLLEGRKATTHWAYLEPLRKAYPDAVIVDDVLYVEDRNIYTSAGSAAGLDLCLHIIRQDYGARIANAMAQRLVLPAHRDGGQAQFVPRPLSRETGNLAPLLDHLRKSLSEHHTLDSIAAIAKISKRTLIRRFQETTGMPPLAWLVHERVGHARYLLETTQAGIDEIAFRCGFGSAETFRHHFREKIGTSPTSYRRAFTYR